MSGKSHVYVYLRPPLQPGMVLNGFIHQAIGNTFVGGTCALPSAILVLGKGLARIFLNCCPKMMRVDALLYALFYRS